jgi:hypothetical protein
MPERIYEDEIQEQKNGVFTPFFLIIKLSSNPVLSRPLAKKVV